MADTDQEKTEEPTSKREEDFRAEGQIAKSQELSMVASFFAILALFQLNGREMIAQMGTLLKETFKAVATVDLSAGGLGSLPSLALWPMLKLLTPMFILLTVIGIGANIAQTGFIFTMKPLMPKFEKLNPLEGLKQLLSMNSLFELGKNIAKIAVIFALAYSAIKDDLPNFIAVGQRDVLEIFAYFAEICFRVLYRILLFLMLLSAIDFAYKKYDLLQKMKMTKQEVKDEAKNMNGDPKMKGEFAKKRNKLATSRMMAAIPRADVVVTNPTHFAVALEYKRGEMVAPRVVAKGADHMAFKIREIAKIYGVPVVESPPLARMLFASVKIGQQIPEHLYAAVAELLAYVFKLGKKAA